MIYVYIYIRIYIHIYTYQMTPMWASWRPKPSKSSKRANQARKQSSKPDKTSKTYQASRTNRADKAKQTKQDSIQHANQQASQQAEPPSRKQWYRQHHEWTAGTRRPGCPSSSVLLALSSLPSIALALSLHTYIYIYMLASPFLCHRLSLTLSVFFYIYIYIYIFIYIYIHGYLPCRCCCIFFTAHGTKVWQKSTAENKSVALCHEPNAIQLTHPLQLLAPDLCKHSVVFLGLLATLRQVKQRSRFFSATVVADFAGQLVLPHWMQFTEVELYHSQSGQCATQDSIAARWQHSGNIGGDFPQLFQIELIVSAVLVETKGPLLH